MTIADLKMYASGLYGATLTAPYTFQGVTFPYYNFDPMSWIAFCGLAKNQDPTETQYLPIFDNPITDIPATNAQLTSGIDNMFIPKLKNTWILNKVYTDIDSLILVDNAGIDAAWASYDTAYVPPAQIDSLATANGKISALQTSVAAISTRTSSSFTLSTSGTGATGTQVSATKDSTVRVTYTTSTTVTLGGSPTSQVVVKICSTNSATEANWTEVGRTASSQPTTLSVTVGQQVSNSGQIIADVPAGWYVKAVNSGTGTHSEVFVSGQKTIYG